MPGHDVVCQLYVYIPLGYRHSANLHRTPLSVITDTGTFSRIDLKFAAHCHTRFESVVRDFLFACVNANLCSLETENISHLSNSSYIPQTLSKAVLWARHSRYKTISLQQNNFNQQGIWTRCANRQVRIHRDSRAVLQ